jgi:hypothetical protein
LICSYAEGYEYQLEDGYSSIPLRGPDEELRIAVMPTFTDNCKYCGAQLNQVNLRSKYKSFIKVLEKFIDLDLDVSESFNVRDSFFL